MKRSLKKFQTGYSQRKLRSLARWELIRAKGKSRFVSRTALTYTLIMIPANSYIHYFFDGESQSLLSAIFSSRTIKAAIMGLVISCISWATMEHDYKKALVEYGRTGGSLNS